MRVNYGQTVHGEEEIAAVLEVLRTSTQMGPKVRAMQEQVSALFAKNHGIMVNSGSSANYLAVELLNLPEGSEVITPALTFATTVAPIVRSRLVPVAADGGDLEGRQRRERVAEREARRLLVVHHRGTPAAPGRGSRERDTQRGAA